MNRGTEAFWLLTEPFEADPDARFLIPTRPVRALLESLRAALAKRSGWIVLVGEPGIGKSVLMRLLVESLDDRSTIALVPDAGVDPGELRDQLDAQLGEAGAALTSENLLRAHRAGRRPLVILEGAADLTEESARELDAAFSAPDEARPPALLADLIAVIDAAPDAPLPDWARARRPVKFVLGSLDAADTAEYVRRRVRLAAGGERDLFDAGALDEVFRRTAGRPDAINRLCGLALDQVAAAGRSRVGSEDVRNAAELLGDLIGEVQLALAITEAEASALEPAADANRHPSSSPSASPSRTDRAIHPSATRAAPRLAPDADATPASLPAADPRLRSSRSADRDTRWKLAVAVAVGCALGIGLTLLWLGPQSVRPGPGGAVGGFAEEVTARVVPATEAAAPAPNGPADVAQAETTGPIAGPTAPIVFAEPDDALAARSSEGASESPGEEFAELPGGGSVGSRNVAPSVHPEAAVAPIGSLPAVAAPAPPEPLTNVVATETLELPAAEVARTRLPTHQGAPILASAFRQQAAAGTAWSVTLLGPSDAARTPIERAELAHAEFDGRLRTLVSIEGTGDRRAARVLDEGGDPTGESARVFWPEDRVMRSIAADDPFSGTGFRYSDFRPHHVRDYSIVSLAGHRLDGEPVFIVTAVLAGPDPQGSFEFVVAERDAHLLEIREFANASATPTRRLLMARPDAVRSPDGDQIGHWSVLGPDDRPLGRAQIAISKLAESAGPELFTFSRLSDPAFSVPKR